MDGRMMKELMKGGRRWWLINLLLNFGPHDKWGFAPSRSSMPEGEGIDPHDHPLTGEPLIGDLTNKQGKRKEKPSSIQFNQ